MAKCSDRNGRTADSGTLSKADRDAMMRILVNAGFWAVGEAHDPPAPNVNNYTIEASGLGWSHVVHFSGAPTPQHLALIGAVGRTAIGSTYFKVVNSHPSGHLAPMPMN